MPERADVLQLGFDLLAQRFGHRAGDVGCLVDPAALLTGGRIDIPQRRPEPKCPIADGKLGRHRQAALLQPPKQVPPAVRVLPKPVHDRQNVLLSILVRADNNQHTLTITVQPRGVK